MFCRAAKEYLTSRGVKYKEVDVEANPEAGMYITNKTGQMGVPVIEIGDETILGFDRPRIDLALRDKKLVD